MPEFLVLQARGETWTNKANKSSEPHVRWWRARGKLSRAGGRAWSPPACRGRDQCSLYPQHNSLVAIRENQMWFWSLPYSLLNAVVFFLLIYQPLNILRLSFGLWRELLARELLRLGSREGPSLQRSLLGGLAFSPVLAKSLRWASVALVGLGSMPRSARLAHLLKGIS